MGLIKNYKRRGVTVEQTIQQESSIPQNQNLQQKIKEKILPDYNKILSSPPNHKSHIEN